MTFVLTPRSHYNNITKSRACFLLSLLEGLSIGFPSHMIESNIDVYHDTATHDKLIFPSAIKHILTHLHIPIPHNRRFLGMVAISQKSLKMSAIQHAAKQPHH